MQARDDRAETDNSIDIKYWKTLAAMSGPLFLKASVVDHLHTKRHPNRR